MRPGWPVFGPKPGAAPPLTSKCLVIMHTIPLDCFRPSRSRNFRGISQRRLLTDREAQKWPRARSQSAEPFNRPACLVGTHRPANLGLQAHERSMSQCDHTETPWSIPRCPGKSSPELVGGIDVGAPHVVKQGGRTSPPLEFSSHRFSIRRPIVEAEGFVAATDCSKQGRYRR
jgi:hypothetical protein